MEKEDFSQEEAKNRKRGRKPGKSKNPLQESVKEVEEIRKLRTDRKTRAERRRLIDLAERGSLARRRRFRVRESKKKRNRSKSEPKQKVRRSKRRKIGKYLDNIRRGVLETLSRKVKFNTKVKKAKKDKERLEGQ